MPTVLETRTTCIATIRDENTTPNGMLFAGDVAASIMAVIDSEVIRLLVLDSELGIYVDYDPSKHATTHNKVEEIKAHLLQFLLSDRGETLGECELRIPSVEGDAAIRVFERIIDVLEPYSSEVLRVVAVGKWRRFKDGLSDGYKGVILAHKRELVYKAFMLNCVSAAADIIISMPLYGLDQTPYFEELFRRSMLAEDFYSRVAAFYELRSTDTKLSDFLSNATPVILGCLGKIIACTALLADRSQGHDKLIYVLSDNMWAYCGQIEGERRNTGSRLYKIATSYLESTHEEGESLIPIIGQHCQSYAIREEENSSFAKCFVMLSAVLNYHAHKSYLERKVHEEISGERIQRLEALSTKEKLVEGYRDIINSLCCYPLATVLMVTSSVEISLRELDKFRMGEDSHKISASPTSVAARSSLQEELNSAGESNACSPDYWDRMKINSAIGKRSSNGHCRCHSR